MSLTGKNAKSLRKKDVQEQKSISIGFKKLVFAHKASSGDTTISLGALSTPTEMSSLGFVNPSSTDLLAANLFFFKKNLTLVSSSKGLLIQDLSYKITASGTISFQGFTAEEGEIFTGVIDNVAKTGLQVVDAAPLVASGDLAVASTDFAVGGKFKVNDHSGQQVGAVLVYRNGAQQFRNSGNSSTVQDGNYYEVDAGDGFSSLIRFNTDPTGQSDSILVVSNGLLVERPDGSLMNAIESSQGQIDAIIPTVAALAGVPETDFQAAPNNQDLKQFGDIVTGLLDVEIPFSTDWENVSSPVSNVTNTDFTMRKRRVGSDLLMEVKWVHSGTPGAATNIQFTLPDSLEADSGILSKLTGSATGLGTGTFRDVSTGRRYALNAGYNSSTTIELYAMLVDANDIVYDQLNTSGFPSPQESGDRIQMWLRIPIEGWEATRTLREHLQDAGVL